MDVSACLNEADAKFVYEMLGACSATRAGLSSRNDLSLGGARRMTETVVSPIFTHGTRDIIRFIGHHCFLSDETVDKAPEVIAQPRHHASVASIQEEIQRRVASELHDSTCQYLVAASLGVMRIRASLRDSLKTEQICDDIEASIDDALREIRAVSYLWYPQTLMADGLKATVENYADGFAARTGLHVTTEIVPGADRLPYEKQRAVLRVIQEALTNVFRHANASKVDIVLLAAGSRFELLISDNGRGMPASGTPTDSRAGTLGVGIPSMRARLQRIGGTLEIVRRSRAPRRGTVLRAVFSHDIEADGRHPRKVLAIKPRAAAPPEVGRQAVPAAHRSPRP